MWTDTSEWALPDHDDTSSSAVVNDENNMSSILDSCIEEKDTFRGHASTHTTHQKQSSSSSGEYWGKSLLQSSRRMPNAIVSRAGSNGCSPGPSTPRLCIESVAVPEKPSVKHLIAKKLDLLCVTLCEKFNPGCSSNEERAGISEESSGTAESSDSEHGGGADSACLNLGSIGSIALQVDKGRRGSGAQLVVDHVRPGQLADLGGVIKRGDVLTAVDGTALRRSDAPLASLAESLLASPRARRSPMQRLNFRRGSEIYSVDSPRQLLPECVLPPGLMAEALRGRDVQRESSDRSRSGRSTERSPDSGRSNPVEDRSSSPAARAARGALPPAAAARDPAAAELCVTPRGCGGGGGGEGGGGEGGVPTGDVWVAEVALPQHLMTPRGALVAEVRSFTF